jgi:hypothetical protein
MPGLLSRGTEAAEQLAQDERAQQADQEEAGDVSATVLLARWPARLFAARVVLA